MYKAIFFDLDGTLLPMDLKEFLEHYLHLVGAFFQTKGYDGKQVCDGIMKNLETMLAGSEDHTTNEERFWAGFPGYMSQTYGQSAPWKELFEEFYTTWFGKLEEKTQTAPLAAKAVARLHEKGYRLILATNPVFPAMCTAQRLAWTGVNPAFFERVTSYENSRFAKPDPRYYQENLEVCGLCANEVLMVGNDTRDDGVASAVGMDVYIVTDCLVEHEKGSAPLDTLPHGTMEDFAAYVETLPEV